MATAETTAKHVDMNADLVADLEHLAHKLVGSNDFRAFVLMCEELEDIDLCDGSTLLSSDEAQAAVGIVYVAVEGWRK